MTFNCTPENIRELRLRFEDATVKCSERGLYQASKWAAEMLDSLMPVDEPEDSGDTQPDIATFQSSTSAYLKPQDPEEALLEAQERHKYLLAKSYFDAKEYDRCASVFLPHSSAAIPLVTRVAKPKAAPRKGKARASTASTSSEGKKASLQNPYPHLSQKSLFLALYAKYMAGEKRRNEETEMILGPLDDGRVVNHELTSIAQGLEAWFSDRRAMGLEDQGEGWLEYLYGVVLMKAKNQAEAKEWLIKSVHLYPYNWSAWQELNDLAESVDDLAQIVEDLPQNLMTLIFHLHCSQELYQTTEDIHKILTELEVLFPTSVFLKTQRALLFYHSKDFEEASQIFSEILTAHPYRLDCLDHYSNILYVMEARPQLAFIAQVATEVDKFRPETCCVVGNYYSLRSEHEKAVVYFRRALTLDRSFLSAWTLMGHEYIEMKNTHAAIESYRRGVDVNPKDYRAWYGLGQAYEVLDMVFYALYYYERAAALRPYDPKMWQAVGSCYAKMERFEQSIHALKRAIVASSYYEPTGNGFQSFSSGYRSFGSVPLSKRILDPDILHQIATLYERLNDEETAARYMELTLQQEGGAPAEDDDDTDTLADEDATPGGGNGGRPSSFSQKSNEPEEERIGTGVTASTSKARLWLARWSLKHDDLDRADQLASELCQDGIEVDEAKALIRDVRARKEGDMHD